MAKVKKATQPYVPLFMNLEDLPGQVRDVAEWIAAEFEKTGLWPSQTRVWREIALRGHPHDLVVNEGAQVFAHLGQSPKDDEVVKLNPWVLYDTGRSRPAFVRAYEVYTDAMKRLHHEPIARISREGMSKRFGLPMGSKELHQLIWVLFSSLGGSWDEKKIDSDWSFEFGVGAMKNPMPTLEEQFLRRPHKTPRSTGSLGFDLDDAFSKKVSRVGRKRIAPRRSSRKEWDVFVSHASEDKKAFVDPLVHALRAAGLDVWYDSQVLKLGDSLRDHIDTGLAKSRYGIVVLSRAFFKKQKHWTRKELGGLFDREDGDKKVILPIWHDLTKQEVAARSPMLVGRVAALSSDGIDEVVRAVVEVVAKGAAAGQLNRRRATVKGAKVVPDIGELGAGYNLPFSFTIVIDRERFAITVRDRYRVTVDRETASRGTGRWHGRLLGDHVFNSSWQKNAEIYALLDKAINGELNRRRR